MSINPAALRAAIEAEMVDRCRITRQEGEPTHDESGATVYADAPSTIYEGKCLIDQMSAQAKTVAGFDLELDVFDLALPMNAACVLKGDDLVVLVCANDADIVGDAFQVGTTFGAGTMAPTRRIAAVRVGRAQRIVSD